MLLLPFTSDGGIIMWRLGARLGPRHPGLKQLTTIKRGRQGRRPCRPSVYIEKNYLPPPGLELKAHACTLIYCLVYNFCNNVLLFPMLDLRVHAMNETNPSNCTN